MFRLRLGAALFTRISRPPNVLTVWATADRHASSLEMSASIEMTWRPVADRRSARSRALSICNSTIATAAPAAASASQIPAPMPCAPPVTSAIRPSKCMSVPLLKGIDSWIHSGDRRSGRTDFHPAHRRTSVGLEQIDDHLGYVARLHVPGFRRRTTQPRGHRAGGNQADPNPFRAQIEEQRLGESLQAEFGRVVSDTAAERVAARAASKIDDVSALCAPEERKYRLT